MANRDEKDYGKKVRELFKEWANTTIWPILSSKIMIVFLVISSISYFLFKKEAMLWIFFIISTSLYGRYQREEGFVDGYSEKEDEVESNQTLEEILKYFKSRKKTKHHTKT